MSNVYDILKERGFIEQMTHEEEIKELLAKEKVTFYIGFDPTADSLHIGHFLTIVAMGHMQRAGHRPIALMGGGTGMIGDPTDRTDMRRMLTREEVKSNVECFKKQMARFIEFEQDQAIIADNADWLFELKYIDFLRDYGIHFSVNRMLAADSYKKRFENGLSFLEFNYMIMQSYDFLELNKRYDCKLQLGGNDQWSNIISGVDLIRRVESKDAYGMTFTILTKSDGQKMGKTASGAIWLDPKKTTPFEFFQYWRNIDDADVEKCLKLMTFLSMEEINELSKLEGSEINKAKEILAYETTKLVHGEEEAQKALDGAKALFTGSGNLDNVPTTEITKSDFGSEMNMIDLLSRTGLIGSKSEGRRLIQQNGISVSGSKITTIDHMVAAGDFKDGEIIVQKGKKIFHKVKLV